MLLPPLYLRHAHKLRAPAVGVRVEDVRGGRRCRLVQYGLAICGTVAVGCTIAMRSAVGVTICSAIGIPIGGGHRRRIPRRQPSQRNQREVHIRDGRAVGGDGVHWGAEEAGLWEG